MHATYGLKYINIYNYILYINIAKIRIIQQTREVRSARQLVNATALGLAYPAARQMACTSCSVGISDLKPLTGTSADQLPHTKSRSLATAKVAVFKAIILTVEPQPAGPTFARSALTARARPEIYK